MTRKTHQDLILLPEKRKLKKFLRSRMGGNIGLGETISISKADAPVLPPAMGSFHGSQFILGETKLLEGHFGITIGLLRSWWVPSGGLGIRSQNRVLLAYHMGS